LSVQKPTRELSIEETLRWAFDLYMRNFVLFLAPVLVVSLIGGGISMVVSDYFASIPTLDPLAGEAALAQVWDALVASLAALVLLLLAYWVMDSLVFGVCVKLAADSVEGGRASLGVAFGSASRKLVSLLVATFVVGIIVVFGLMLLLVPGVIFAVMFCLVVPVILVENVGALDSLSRSRALVRGRWLNTFVVFLVVLLIAGFVSYVGMLIGTPFGVFHWIVSAVLDAFATPLVLILMAVHYYSMRAREQPPVPAPAPPLPPS